MTKFDHLRSEVLSPGWRHGILLISLVGCLILGAGASPRVFAQDDECPSLVGNGGFENGTTGWHIQSNGTYQIIAPSTAISVHSGTFAAYLGGVNHASDSIGTTLTLPPDKLAILTYWWQIDTEEDGVGADSMDVIVASPVGTPLQTLTTYTDLDAITTEFRQAALDLSAFAGQTIQVRFVVETDANLETGFVVDDVAVSACVQLSHYSVFLPLTRR